MSDPRLRQATGKMIPGTRTGDSKVAQPVTTTTLTPNQPNAGQCYVLLGKSTSDGTTNLFDFQNIPQTYSDLRVRIMGAIDIGAGGVGTCYLQVNGDASESYRELHSNFRDSATPLTIPEIEVSPVDPDIGFDLPGPTFSGFTYPQASGIAEVLIAEYTTESFWKTMQALGSEFSTNGDGTLDAARSSYRTCQWMNLDPIISVQVGTVTALGGGGSGEVFVSGTTCTLHAIC